MKKSRGLALIACSLLVTSCSAFNMKDDSLGTTIIDTTDPFPTLFNKETGVMKAQDEDETYIFPDLITLRYHRDDNDYLSKRFWIWCDGAAPETEFDMTADEDGYTYSFTFSPLELFKIKTNSFSFMVKTTGTWDGKSVEVPISYVDYPPTLITSGENEGKYVLELYALANGTSLDIYKTKEDAQSDQVQTAFISSDYKKLNIYTKDGTGNGESIITDLKLYKFTGSYLSMSIESQETNKSKYLLFSASNINKQNVAIKFENKLTINCKYVLELTFKDKPDKVTSYTVGYDNLYNTPEFLALSYDGDDLGSRVIKNGNESKTTFKVWAPTASRMVLKVYDVGYDANFLDESAYNNVFEQSKCSSYRSYEMTLDPHEFVWNYTINEDLNGKYYTYKVYNTLGTSEVVDPYAYSASVDGQRGMVVDFDSIEATPDGYDEVPLKWDGVKDYDISTPQELAISEVHIRDLTMSDTWGGNPELKGTFKGFIEEGTTYSTNVDGQEVTVKTGYDHLVEYGVNAIQILPFFDQDNGERARKEVTYNEGEEDEYSAQVVDYSTLGEFNWGYNPLNYNVLEGSYSTDPRDGYVRIKEFRELITKFATNENHTRIIMDVVYNHVSSAPTSNFEKLMPKYYFRYNADGSYSDASGCGNEVKTEAPMMRKFIVDSVVHWATHYKIKGFRFDLMGAIDLETMNQVANALYQIDPDIVVYGEGWYAAAPRLKGSLCAVNQNIGNNLYPGRDAIDSDAKYIGSGYVGGFNNGGRDALKGDNSMSNGSYWGFIAKGEDNDEVRNRAAKMMLGANGYDGCPWNPLQNVNYVSCHDNYTLFDQLNYTLSDDGGITEPDIEVVAKASVSVNGMVLMSNGISFINGGEELFRTKIEYAEETQPDEVMMYGKRITHNSYKSSDLTNAYDYSRKAKLLDYYNMYCELVDLKKELTFSDEIVTWDDSTRTYKSGDAINVETANTHDCQLAIYRKGKDGSAYHVLLTARKDKGTYYCEGETVFNNSSAEITSDIDGFDAKGPYSLVIIKG